MANTAGTQKLMLGISTNDETYLRGATVLHLQANDGGQEVTILNNGNVGIGTTAPSYKLHVKSNSSGGGIAIERSGGAANTVLQFKNEIASDRAKILFGGTDEELAFFSGGGGAEHVRITNAGNVLIGTTTDAGYKLDVNGTGRFVNGVNMATTSGNVGIGIVSPASSLSNSAILNAAASGLSTSIKGLNWEMPASAYSQGYVASFVNSQTAVVNSNAGVLIKVGSTDTTTRLLSVESGGVNRFEVRGDGNVGIGTTGPAYKLSLSGAATDWSTSPSIAFYDAVVGVVADSRNWLIGNVATNYGDLVFANSTAQGGNPNENVRMVINKSGNVGIGTVSPLTPLTVKGGGGIAPVTSGTSTNATFRVEGSATPVIDFGAITATGLGWIQATDRTSLNLNYGLALNQNGGNVLIGTTTDEGQKLQVNGAARVKGGLYAGAGSLAVDPYHALFGGITYFSHPFQIERTITAAATTGAQTINKPAGTVNIAAGGSSVVVTNSYVTTSSIIFGTIRTNDTSNQYISSIVAAAGSFTINLKTTVDAETSIGFLVTN